jgi:large subunit ribosomal protein L31e
VWNTDSCFKRRAPRAIKAIKTFIQKQMGTTDVRMDRVLNQKVWEKGIRNVPRRLRVQVSRKLDEGKEGALYAQVTAVEGSAKGLLTREVIEEEQ